MQTVLCHRCCFLFLFLSFTSPIHYFSLNSIGMDEDIFSMIYTLIYGTSFAIRSVTVEQKSWNKTRNDSYTVKVKEEKVVSKYIKISKYRVKRNAIAHFSYINCVRFVICFTTFAQCFFFFSLGITINLCRIV